MARKKAANGAGSFEREAASRGSSAPYCARPGRSSGASASRPRLGEQTDALARRQGAKIARDVEAGKIAFEDVPRPKVAGPAGDWRTVRELVSGGSPPSPGTRQQPR